jgi:hydroxyethylthiazole kinase-like uncharacterized protein yjeF
MSRLRRNKLQKTDKSVAQKSPTTNPHGPLVLTPAFLRGWPLPEPDEAGDKEERGRVLVVGGAPEMPGAVILAGVAALRAGAGKLRIATCASIASSVAVAIPEARVFSLPETKSGAIAAEAAEELVERANEVNTVLLGPGLVDEAEVIALMKRTLPGLKCQSIVLDAAAFQLLAGAPESLHHLGGRAIITPHRGEMAHLLGQEKEAVSQHPLEAAREAAERFQAVAALKGAETFIAAPGGAIYCNRTGNVGLATSGSGDTLAGIVAGLAARGAEPEKAAAWAAYLHGRAGDKLAHKMGRLGFLARELLAEIPGLMDELR